MNPNQQVLSDEQILRKRDTHVGGPTPSYPLDNSDWLNFARAIESATLAALAQQAQEPFAYMDDGVAAGVIGGQEVLLSAAIRGAPGGTLNFPLYTTPQPQPAPPVPAPVASVAGLVARIKGDAKHAAYMAEIDNTDARDNTLHKLALSVDELASSVHQQPTPAPVPAPVDEREALKKLESVAYAAFSHIASANYPNRVKEASSWLRDGFDEARAALQSPAPQTKGGEA